MKNYNQNSALTRRPGIRLIGMLAGLLISTQALAGTGTATFVFKDGPVTNPAGTTPQMTLTLEWVNAGVFVTSTVVVTIAPGDTRAIVRNKAQAALQADPAIAAAFTLAPNGMILAKVEWVTLTPNPGIFACTATIMNGVKTGTPPILTNSVTGIGMSAGLDPTFGSVFFDIEGSPTTGLVAFAVNGTVISLKTDGASITAIKDSLVAGLKAAGLQVRLDAFSQIVVTKAIVDNLFELGLGGRDGLNVFSGGASFFVTDPGIGITSSASQSCLKPADDSVIEGPEEDSRIFYLLILAIVIMVVGFTALWFRTKGRG